MLISVRCALNMKEQVYHVSLQFQWFLHFSVMEWMEHKLLCCKNHSWRWFNDEFIIGLLKLWPNLLDQKYTLNWLNQNSWWLFWTDFNRTCLIHRLDLATNIIMAKSKELNISLKEHIIHLNKWVKSLWTISKQLQVPRSTVQKIICKYKVTVTVILLPWLGRKWKLSPATERRLVRMVKYQTKTIVFPHFTTYILTPWFLNLQLRRLC